jgi:hypothetical protein
MARGAMVALDTAAAETFTGVPGLAAAGARLEFFVAAAAYLFGATTAVGVDMSSMGEVEFRFSVTTCAGAGRPLSVSGTGRLA